MKSQTFGSRIILVLLLLLNCFSVSADVGRTAVKITDGTEIAQVDTAGNLCVTISGSGSVSIGSVKIGDSAYTLTKTAIDMTTTGDHTIITPTSDKALRIVKMVFWCNASNAVLIYEGTSGEGQTAVAGTMSFPAYSGFAFDGDSWPIKFAANKSLVLNTTTTASTSGFVITYEE